MWAVGWLFTGEEKDEKRQNLVKNRFCGKNLF